MRNIQLKYAVIAIGLVMLVSCGKETTVSDKRSIPLSEAIENPRTVKLSEIADSISFLSLSTDYLMHERDAIIPSDEYLFVGCHAYDWQGNYLFEIGRRGNGPGEEKYLKQIMAVDTMLYSLADKLIVYDKQGNYAGKEQYVFGCIEMSHADKNVVLADWDSIYFLSPELNSIKKMRVIPQWHERTNLHGGRMCHLFTENQDSVLFYNYANDTIYRVLEHEIQPRWIVQLGEDKIANEYLLGGDGKRISEIYNYANRGNLSSAPYFGATDYKIRVFSVHETKGYLFICWQRVRELWEMRHLEPPFDQIAYYDKRTQKTIAVEGEGFVDDLSSLGTFYPWRGIHDNCLIASYWPHELMAKVESLQQRGKPVDKKLADLLENTKEDDNPILVKIHLK